MNYEEVSLEVRKILAKELNLEINKINLNSDLVSDLGIDSFSSIEVVFELEESFKIKISDAEIVKAKIVKDIVDYVTTQINAKVNSQTI